jgi:hypothetical protein
MSNLHRQEVCLKRNLRGYLRLSRIQNLENKSDHALRIKLAENAVDKTVTNDRTKAQDFSDL